MEQTVLPLPFSPLHHWHVGPTFGVFFNLPSLLVYQEGRRRRSWARPLEQLPRRHPPAAPPSSSLNKKVVLLSQTIQLIRSVQVIRSTLYMQSNNEQVHYLCMLISKPTTKHTLYLRFLASDQTMIIGFASPIIIIISSKLIHNIIFVEVVRW
jgi:hypothetical protein